MTMPRTLVYTVALMAAALLPGLAAAQSPETGKETIPGGVEYKPTPPPAAATMDGAPSLLKTKPTVTPPVLPTPSPVTVVPKTPAAPAAPAKPAADQPAAAKGATPPVPPPAKVPPAASAPRSVSPPRAMPAPATGAAPGAAPERSATPPPVGGDEGRPGGVERAPTLEKRAP